MKQELKTHEAFKAFAQHTLDNHLAELNTRYEEMKIDKDTLEEAYEAHRKIFEKELDDNIQSLEDAAATDELKSLKKEFLSRLQ